MTYHFSDRFDVQVGGRENRLTQHFYETMTGSSTPFLSPDGSQSPYIQPTLRAQSRPFTYLFKMLRGQFRGCSERKLMDCLTLLGRDVEIVVRAATKRKGQGAVSVSFAWMGMTPAIC